MEKITKVLLKGVLLLALLFLMIGCRTQLIQNDLSSPITLGSFEKARTGILEGLAPLKWEAYEKGKGHIVATKKLTKYLLINRVIEPVYYMAEVDIFFDATRYTIQYKNSINLKYDGENIHKLYNQWVHELDQGIRAHTQMRN